MTKPVKPSWQHRFLADLLLREARASVALDKDPSVHTCSDTCTEYPQCPGNLPKAS